MSGELVVSAVMITLALVFYSLGVWAERIGRYLRPWHVAMFWVGLVFDVAGTYAMGLMTDEIDWFDFHTITGQLAIWLMFGHALWATWVVVKGSERARCGFHRYSLVVWLVWLAPYFGGMLAGMSQL